MEVNQPNIKRSAAAYLNPGKTRYNLERTAMAEKKHEEHGGKKKLHLHSIKHTIAKDGSVVHEHEYKKHPDDEHPSHRVLAGTSSDMDDVHQHLDDNLAPAMQAAAGGQPESEPDAPAGGAPQAEPEPEAAQ